MTEWAWDGDIGTAEIDGLRYRVQIRNTYRGRDLWSAERFHPQFGWGDLVRAMSSREAAVAEAEAIAQHTRDLAPLNREQRRYPRGGTSTPWGPAQHATVHARGVIKYSAAGHGGFHLSARVNAAVPPHLRNDDGWYEEDSGWARVATAFPALFTPWERRHAENTLRQGDPDAWEAHYGRALSPTESHVRAEQQFIRDNADNWVVIGAWSGKNSNGGDVPPGMVGVCATQGGARQSMGGVAVEEKWFLVPAEEYEERGRHGFVVDLGRHQETSSTWEAPSAGPAP